MGSSPIYGASFVVVVSRFTDKHLVEITTTFADVAQRKSIRLISERPTFRNCPTVPILSRWCNGSTWVSKTLGRSSSLWRDAKFLKVVNMKKFDIEEVKQFLAKQGPNTKVYLGADSERIRVNEVWYADYALAVVVHIDGCHGCKIFGFVDRELDYDHKKSKPAMRLMTEVYKVSELFQSLQDVLEDYHVEVHLDLNKSDEFGSSCVVQQAIGYIKGTCNMTPMVKPDAPAASFCADRLKRILAEQELVE